MDGLWDRPGHFAAFLWSVGLFDQNRLGSNSTTTTTTTQINSLLFLIKSNRFIVAITHFWLTWHQAEFRLMPNPLKLNALMFLKCVLN